MFSLRNKITTGFILVLLFSILIVWMAAPIGANAQTVPPEKRTVYVIGNIMGALNFPLLAYIVVDDDIFFADTWYATARDSGPVGLAIDETNENLFVSYEMGDTIEVFGARDATPLGSIFLYGTSDLAGMVVHQGRGQLFVVDRGQNDVFVFDTTTFAQLDNWILPNGSGAWGIDLLGDDLYVADATNTVRWYNIDSHAEIGSFTQPMPAIGIAVTDYPEHLVFTTAFTGTSSLSPYLHKYYVTSGTEDHLQLGTDIKGVTLNPALEIAYVVSDSRLNVVDFTGSMSVLATKQLNWLWSPTDTLASFIPFGGTVKKTCPSHPNGKIYKGDQVTFKVAIQNRHNNPIHVLPITDTYDNTQLHFVSSDPPANDSNDDGQLDWTDIIAQIGADLPTGDWAEIEVVFDALEECEGELLGTNTALMHDVEDDEGFSLPDASGQFDYKINCKCRTNADCDDSVFCNGAEICGVDGSCSSPGNPCPLDDGLWCNGTETDVCNEELQECEHVNAPCEDDGLWCNGEDVCNENTDTCTNSGPPCSDDGQFCNGEETCDDEKDDCVSSGDPCEADEQCNETTDTCEAVEVSDDDSSAPADDDEELWPEGKVTGGCCGCE